MLPDYVAQIEAVSLPAGVTMQLEDPDGILGTHGDSNTPNGVFDADGKVAYVTLGTVADLKIYNAKNGLEVPEADEENVGAYLLVNWDDDNNNDIPDLQESNTGANENDLARLELSLSPAGLNVGTLELIKTGGNAKIWSSSNKQSEVTDLIWNLESETPPSTLWLEGISASGAERDVILELRYTYESSQASDIVKATVVMLNLGNAVYREKESGSNLGHGAIVIAYYGACTKEELCNADNYEIVHMQSAGKAYNLLTNITNNGGLDAYGCYANTSINYQDRLDIIKTTSEIHDVDYALVNVLEPDNWNDTVSGISALRCDGLIEVCYEMHNINVWGKIVGGTTHYNIKNDDYENEHNDTRTPLNKGLIPVTQCGYDSEYEGAEWNTVFVRRNLCQPVGQSGGN